MVLGVSMLLLLGLIVFVGFHLLPTFAVARAGLVARFGEGGYMGLFTVGSLVGLSLLIAGYANAAYVPVYAPPPWGRHIAQALMLAAALLIVAAFVPNSLKGRVRHPMLWGVALWGLAHLLANGALADVLLFGKPQPLGRNLLALGLGVALYATLYGIHPWLFGVAPG
jgi:uncharacterized membrane protein